MSLVHPPTAFPPFLPLVVWVFSAVPLAVGGSLQCPLYTHSLPLIFASSRLIFSAVPLQLVVHYNVPCTPTAFPPFLPLVVWVFAAVPLVGGSLQCPLYTHSLPPIFASSRLGLLCSSPCSWWFITMSLPIFASSRLVFSAVPLAVGGSLQCLLYTHSLPPHFCL